MQIKIFNGLFVALAFMFSFNVFSSLNVKEGLWKYDTKVLLNGKDVNISNMMNEAMAKLSPEQKKQFNEAMKSASKGEMSVKGNSIHSDLKSEICITSEMIKKGYLTPENEVGCIHKVTQNSATKLAGTYDCKDKFKGSFEMTASSPLLLIGKMQGQDTQGNKVNINYTARRIAESCKN